MLLKAYLLPHPPLAVPSVGNGMEEKIQSTVNALTNVAKEISELSPECITIVTPHAEPLSSKFCISSGSRASGSFSQFGAPQTRLGTEYDEPIALKIMAQAAHMGVDIGHYSSDSGVLDHGVLVPLWHINRFYTSYKIVRIAISGLGASEHYRLGMALSQAADSLNKKTVLIASGDLSHKLSKSGPYGFDPAGPEFDRQVQDMFIEGDFSKLFHMPESFLRKAAECGYKGLVVLAGCFDGKKIDSRVLSYEGPFGVGYAVACVTGAGDAEKLSGGLANE